MTLALLLELLERRSIRELRLEIAAPLVAYERALSECGRAATVVLNEDSTPLRVSESHVRNLIDAYVSRELSAIELNYIANALDLSEDAEYSTASVREVVFSLSSPEVNGQLSEDRIIELLNELSRGAA